MKQVVAFLVLLLALGAAAEAANRTATSHRRASFMPGKRQIMAAEGGDAAVSVASGSAAATALPVPTVDHTKKAGGGYSASSPLYEKQQAVETYLKRIKEEENTAVSVVTKHPLALLSSFLLDILLVVAVAYLYRRYKEEPRTPEFAASPGDSFTFGLFEVGNLKRDGLKMCLLGCCCPAIRWADTVSAVKVKFMDFWVALMLALVLILLGGPTAGVSAVAFCLIGIYIRQRLRLYFGHEGSKPKTLALDCLAWCCCPCCAIIQEAREVEYVQRKQ